ncbi:DUF2169 domain-containing protein [Halomonas sp. ATBC28]|uniref:DUF2169 domain-containing protein n=1 Tax=Halomonas sp. ATBC28 TaxID=2545264 RepID=UPI00110D7BF7|nr:DUF2169 domain-containing protein [Halomonas sp. ATBC28]TMU28891.1 DUF2169 domain-containing protein [Halomonas sp. ATBC28]
MSNFSFSFLLLASCTLRSPTGQPRSTWQVRVQVGPLDKRLIVRGPREFRWQLLGGWRVTDPSPVSEVPLDYRYAFGGHYSLPDGDDLANTLYYPDNPAGRGWLPSRADYKRVSSEVIRYLKPDLNAVTRLPAPQLEDPDWLVTSPFDRPAPASFGPIAPWWEPRVSYQGTFDNHWKTQRLPYWPEDFDYRFHHSAPADLIAPDYLRGDELMILTDMSEKPLFTQALKKLGPLRPDEVYGFEPALVAGGEWSVNNLAKLNLDIHLTILRQMAPPEIPFSGVKVDID